MNYPFNAEMSVVAFLKSNNIITLPIDADGQRSIYASCNSSDGGWIGGKTKKILPYAIVECVNSEVYATPSGNE
jgi:hypothetical protein